MAKYCKFYYEVYKIHQISNTTNKSLHNLDYHFRCSVVMIKTKRKRCDFKKIKKP